MCVCACACLCVSHVTLRNVLLVLFYVFFLIFLFILTPSPFFSRSLSCPEALQLVTVLSLSPVHCWKGGTTSCERGAWVIKSQSWDFIKPPFKVSSAPGRQGDGGFEFVPLAERKVERGEEDSSHSDLWFPLLNRKGGGRCCLGDHRCAGSACVGMHAHKHIKCPLLVWGFLWLSQQPLCLSENIEGDIVFSRRIFLCCFLACWLCCWLQMIKQTKGRI